MYLQLIGHLAGQDAAAEDSIRRTGEMTFLLVVVV